MLAAWAGFRLLIWASRPLGALIYRWEEDGGRFDFSDARELGQFVIYLAFAAVVFAVSLPISRAATAETNESAAFSLAFTTIRVITFLCIVPGVLSLAFEMFEIFIDYLRREGGEHYTLWHQARFRLRTAFAITVNLGFVSLFWIFARHLSNALTRRLRVRPMAKP